MAAKRYSLKDKLRYSFENTLSKGTVAIIGWLALVSLFIVSIAATIIALTGIKPDDGDQMNFVEAAWQSLMRTLDAGNLAGDLGWPIRAVMLTVTLGGIFIISILIGTLTSGIEGTLEELRKGRSRVLESNHTLILGWSPKIFSIISELLIANASQKKPRIVIMADKDKVEMEDEIRSKFPNTKNTKIICRTGSPLDLYDLEVVSPHEAKSIVILSPEEGNADTHVIKSIMAITNNPNRKQDKYHIVAEIKDEANLEAGTLVGGDEAVLVLSGDLIARVTAQTCRQSGLSVVYTELLDFDGAEIYFKEEGALINKTYKEACFAFEESAVMGLFHTTDGSVSINPPMETVLKKGDQVIAISEDDDSLIASNMKEFSISTNSITESKVREIKKEKTLIMGWNDRGITIVKELDNYVAAGSEILIVAETSAAEDAAKSLNTELKKQKLEFKKGNINERALLNSINIPSYDYIIILCYPELEVQEADAKTLIALLHLRSMADQGNHDFSIVSEMLDIRNRELAEVTKADDFIVSDKLISLMLSQLSENKHLKKVFDRLFEAEGSEIYLKPATDYIKPNEAVNFYTVLESAAKKGETAIGYRIQADASNPEKAYGVKVNPKKSDKLAFSENDKIIVLAED